MTAHLRFLRCGESAMIVECADLDAALRLYAALDAAVKRARTVDGCGNDSVLAAVTQLLPAARTVYVAYDPLTAGLPSGTGRQATPTRPVSPTRPAGDADGADRFRAALEAVIAGLGPGAAQVRDRRVVEIPVTYDGEDLADVAALLGISEEQVVARHSGHTWTVAFGGFAPGFDYLTGGDPIFDVPRRTTPRLAVPAGAVGLAGTFSGVYPRSSSGGWQLIGTTTTPMWDDAAEPPALLRPGDTVRFTPVRAEAAIAADTAVAGSPAAAGPATPSATTAEPIAPDGPCATLEVINPGVLATIQDAGRHAPEMGVTGSGAADPAAFLLANELVGNPGHTPVIELTYGGASFTAHGDLVVAVAGAPAAVSIVTPPAVAQARPPFAVTRQEAFLLRDGETLVIGAPASGLRDYVAVRGGFDVPTILGSASTDTMSGIGPAPLRHGDRLRVRTAAASVGLPRPWPDDLPRARAVSELAVTLGPRDDWFTADGIRTFLDTTWTVTAQSNRVGLRLTATDATDAAHADATSPAIERRDPHAELKSEATVPGSIEVPGDGLPLIFLRDQPVTGGYPVIAVLTRAALATAGQLPPGARVRFTTRDATTSGIAAPDATSHDHETNETTTSTAHDGHTATVERTI